MTRSYAQAALFAPDLGEKSVNPDRGSDTTADMMALEKKARRAPRAGTIGLLFTCLGIVACDPADADEVDVIEDDDPLVADEVVLADLDYENGAHVQFTYDRISGDYGIHQYGSTEDGSAPVVRGELDSILATYVEITPDDLPIPSLLLDEPQEDGEGPVATVDLTARVVTEDQVVAEGLDVSAALPPLVGFTCSSAYWTNNSSDWFETNRWDDKTFYASDYGGKHKYTDSYVFNCLPSGSPSYQTARHRIYYKGTFGYVKHHDVSVQAGGWDVEHKGSIKRYRKVRYDAYNDARYTRQGRFHN